MKIKFFTLLFLCCIICLGNVSCFTLNKEKYYDELVTENDSKFSPSGKYNLSLGIDRDENASFYYFTITLDDKIIYICDEKYYRRHTFFLCWDDREDIVWCYSGDIGSYYWINENDEWKKYTFYGENANNVTPPNILKILRPRSFGENN
jgi:hypothetical protein